MYPNETEENKIQLTGKVQALETCFLREKKKLPIREQQSYPICCLSGKENKTSSGFTIKFCITKGFTHLCKTLLAESKRQT